MHGRVKVRTTAEQEALKKKERAEKLALYKAGANLTFAKRNQKIYDEELMKVTEKMLLQNSDINTLWNIRREAIVNNDWDKEEFYQKELVLTESCLRDNPKSYCVWHQRCWIMDRMAEPDWKRELMLCAKCLNLDERNFHCWGYRDFVVQRAGISPAEEFDFSTTKILNNFSNYSSWHYRSRLLSKIFKDSDETSINNRIKEELDLVMNATFTDPNDSSAWFYQRWLLDTHETSTPLSRVLLNDKTVVLSFVKDVCSNSISLQVNKNEIKEIRWSSQRKMKFSKLWHGEFKEPINNLIETSEVIIKVDENAYILQHIGASSWAYKNKESRCGNNEDQLLEQLESYKRLAEMEPNNKWAILTGVLLMRKIDSRKFNNDILNNLNSLIIIDKLRSNYYNDLRSKYTIEAKLLDQWETEANDLQRSRKIDLSSLDLTTLSNEDLGFLQEVNLSNNCLSNSLHQLSCLISCDKLSISSNRLENLNGFPTLSKLRVLSLRNNELKDWDEIFELLARHQLIRIDLRENPICKIDGWRDRLSSIDKNLDLCLE